jgi:hypothetical protein
MVSLHELGAAALVIVVASVMVGIGAVLMTSQGQSMCSADGYTWFKGVGNQTNASALMAVNPLDSSWSGCCEASNTSYPTTQGGYCRVWHTSSQPLNITYQGTTAMNTLGTWLPIIAVVVAAVIVIGLLIQYLGGGLRGRRM